MFVLNNWYVAGFADELAPGTSLARMLCAIPVVLFRASEGQVAALEDRCPHRGMPLGGGVCTGSSLRCPYHGLEFDVTGACTRIPGQERIPPDMRLRTYPLVEQDQMLWIWLGDPAKADASTITRYPYDQDPRWVASHTKTEYACNWELLNDNLLDPSHLRFVHAANVAEQDDIDVAERYERVGRTVHVHRRVDGIEAAPFFASAYPFTGRIDRIWDIEFRPGLFIYTVSAIPAGSGATQENPEIGVHLRHFHGVTPVDENRTLYFFALARNFRLEDQAMTRQMIDQVEGVLEEDRLILERQHSRLLETPSRPLVARRADEGLLHGRRIVREMLSEEAWPPP